MKQAQPSTTTPKAALRPASGRKTATGVFDTWSEPNLWEKQAFTTDLRWGVRYSQSDPLGLKPRGTPLLPGHAFSYAKGNPLYFFDPMGLKECCLCPGGQWLLTGVLKGWAVAGWPGGRFGSFSVPKGTVKCLSNELTLGVSAECEIANAELPSIAVAISMPLWPGVPISGCWTDGFDDQSIFTSGVGLGGVTYGGRRFSPMLGDEGAASGIGAFALNLNCTIKRGYRSHWFYE